MSKDCRRRVIASARRHAPGKGKRIALGLLFLALPGLVLGFVLSYFSDRTRIAPPSWLPAFVVVGILIIIMANLAFQNIEYRFLKDDLASRARRKKEAMSSKTT